MALEHGAVYGGRATGGRLLTPRGRRTRASLVAAAKEIFEQTPFGEARIADIAAQAQVATGTFYTYYDSKEEIFREVATEVLMEMSRAGRLEPDEPGGDEIDAVTDSARRYYRTCLRNVGVARSIEQLAVSDPELARVRRDIVVAGVKRIEAWIRDLQERGICDRTIDARTTAMAIHTMGVRVAYDHLMVGGHEQDIDRVVDAVTRITARTVGLE